MIYFMQSVDGGAVKIGYSADVKARRQTLESLYGKRLALLATMPGGREREAEIHTMFAHLRIGRSEQFRPAADLMAFIDRPLLVSPDPDAVAAMGARWTMLRVGDDFAEMLRRAANFEGVGISEYLDAHLLDFVKKRHEESIVREYKKLGDK